MVQVVEVVVLQCPTSRLAREPVPGATSLQPDPGVRSTGKVLTQTAGSPGSMPAWLLVLWRLSKGVPLQLRAVAGPVQPGTGVQELGWMAHAWVGAGAVQLATVAQVLMHAPELHVSPAGQSALTEQRQTPPPGLEQVWVGFAQEPWPAPAHGVKHCPLAQI